MTASELNKRYSQVILGLLIGCAVLGLLAMFNGSNIVMDSWFLPLLASQIWTQIILLKNKSY